MGAARKIGVKAKYIIAFDGKGHRILQDGILVIENDEIIFVGKKYEGPLDQWIDASNRIVSPGFINTHSHIHSAPVTKSLAEDIGNPLFYFSRLFDLLVPNLKYENEEIVTTSTKLSLYELLTSGTTTAVVMGVKRPELVADIMYRSGIRGYVLPFINSGPWQTEDGKTVVFRKQEKEGFDLVEKAVGFSKICQERYDGKIIAMLGPEYIGGCTPELLKEVRRTAQKTGMRIAIHLSEAVTEFQEALRRYGMTPTQFLESAGLLGEDLLAAHSIYLSGHSWTAYPGDEDLKLLAQYQVSVAHCPWVFASRGFIMESFAKYLRMGVNMSLGTDTCPQNILLEMRYASMLSKIYERDVRATTAGHAFDAATLGGARALGRKDLGRICQGAKADLLFFRLDSPRMSPVRDPIRNIVYYADPTDITDVMIAGKRVVRNGEIEGIDASQLSLKLQKHAEDTWNTIPERDWARRSADEISKLTYPLWEEESKKLNNASLASG